MIYVNLIANGSFNWHIAHVPQSATLRGQRWAALQEFHLDEPDATSNHQEAHSVVAGPPECSLLLGFEVAPSLHVAENWLSF